MTDRLSQQGLRQSTRLWLSLLVGVALLASLARIETANAAFRATSSNLGSDLTAGSWVFRVLAAGETHACASLPAGMIKCWGANSSGQLGNGTTTDSSTPVTVVGPGGSGSLSGVVAVVAGEASSCAAKADGTVWCWGKNDLGQLGDGTLVDSASPVQVLAAGGSGVLADAVYLAAGEQHMCAAKTDRTVWCWGRNTYGQLGDGTSADSTTPVQVLSMTGGGTLNGVLTVAAGELHTCVTVVAGAVYCWGLNAEGQLGNGSLASANRPTLVVGLGGIGTIDGVLEVQAGKVHTCSAKADGTAWCWGRNDEGQLGNNTTTDSTSPVQVQGVGGVGSITEVGSIGAGRYHSCAALDGGSLWCWGRNLNGALGDGTTTNQVTPVQVLGPGGSGTLANVRMVAGGTDVSYTCAQTTDDAVWCWGENTAGVLGDGTTTNRSFPVQAMT